MRRMFLNSLTSRRWFIVALSLSTLSNAQSALIDDRAITIHSTKDVAAKRRAIIEYLWGSDGFPSGRMPTVIQTNIATPVKQLSHLARVDEFRMDLAPGLEALSYHFI